MISTHYFVTVRRRKCLFAGHDYANLSSFLGWKHSHRFTWCNQAWRFWCFCLLVWFRWQATHKEYICGDPLLVFFLQFVAFHVQLLPSFSESFIWLIILGWLPFPLPCENTQTLNMSNSPELVTNTLQANKKDRVFNWHLRLWPKEQWPYH